jgi:hypothetical protein
MGNIRFTCQEDVKGCEQERKEVVLLDENGHPQFKSIICLKCYGVIASERLKTPKIEKKTKGKPKSEEPVSEAKVETSSEAEVAPELVEQAAPEPEVSKTSEVIKPSMEEMISQMEEESKTAVEMLLKLKSEFGLSNPEAAAFLRDRKKTLEAQSSQEPEPVQEEKPETIPSPLPEKEEAERETSTIKPPKVKTIPETEGIFPINFFELVKETKSYRFKLHNEDGVEFMYEITPRPEKYEVVEKNPSAFDGKSLRFKFTKVDDAECPVEPQLVGVE